jgi:hypothetical protein
MKVTLSYTLADGAALDVETDSWDELLEQYAKMGGKNAWLLDQIKSVVADVETNGGVAQVTSSALNGAVVATEEVVSSASPDSEPAPSADQASPASGSQTAPPSNDPWTVSAPEEDTQWPGEATVAREAITKPQTAPAPTAVPSGGITKSTDKFNREFTMGLPDAPNCLCNIPAARMKAKSQKGKWYTQWKCSKSNGDNWREKCDYSEFTN